MCLRMLAGLILLACWVPPGIAQTESRLIDLDIVALDNHGQPVTDLTAGDFRVTDDGKPEKITYFHRNVAAGEPDLAPLPGKRELTNRERGGANNATVILLDLLNQGFETRGMAARRIVQELSHLQQADSLYLYMLTVDGKIFAVRGLSPEGSTAQSPGPPWTSRIKD